MPHHTDLMGGLFGDEEIFVAPCPLADAQRLVCLWHRHHGKVVGHKFILKAAGFKPEHTSRGGSWSSPSRPRVDQHPTGPKTRWVRELNVPTQPRRLEMP